MKKLLFSILGLSFLMLSSCEKITKPTSITIRTITLTDFPALDNGVEWDIVNGPDIFLLFGKNNSILWTSQYFENASPGNDYTFELNYEVFDIDSEYEMNIIDYDSTSDNDFMGDLFFTPYDKDEGTFRVLTSSNMSVTMNLTFNY